MTPKLDLEQCFVGAVTVGERGQVVIPADARKKLDIHTGDRLLVMGHPNREGLMLFKIEAVREFLSHLTVGLSMAEAEEAIPAGGSSKGAKGGTRIGGRG